MEMIKSYLLLTANGAVLVLTSSGLGERPDLLKNLRVGNVQKYVAFEVPLDSVKESYSAHYEHVLNDSEPGDEYIVLDDDGEEIFQNIKLSELGAPVFYE